MSVTESQQATPHEKLRERKLHLTSLEIRNFRAFEHLQIERLGRVNLITGRNNVGKTTVLEAAYLYSHPDVGSALREMMLSREEIVRQENGLYYPITLRPLFHGRHESDLQQEKMSVGPIGSTEASMVIRVGWSHSNSAGPAHTLTTIREPSFSIQRGNNHSSASLRPVLSLGFTSEQKGPVFLRSTRLDPNEVGRLWSLIQLSPWEDEIVEALGLVSPAIKRVSVRSSEGDQGIHVPIVRTSDSPVPFPIRTFGEGMVHLFNLSLALVNARDSVLLIDEVENGLHYSVQPDVWRLILGLASRLNVQVFATTHSWDCIEAFQKAATEDESEEGMLIRLREKSGKIVAACFDEEDLVVITRDSLEVR